MRDYSEIINEKKGTSIGINEKMDCAVIAIAAVCNLSYEESHKLCKKHGRKDRHGMYMENIISAIYAAGYKVEKFRPNLSMILQENGCRYTPKSIHKFYEKYPHDSYLCSTSGHIFALINGNVIDWTEGRKHYINEFYKVEKTDNPILPM